MGKNAAAAQTDQEHAELYDDKAGKEGIGHGSILGEKLRSGLEALDDEAAHENGGNGFSGDAQRQGGDQGAAGDGIVGRFGTGYAFNIAVAEGFRMLGKLTGCIVAEEAGNGSACAGKKPDDISDDPRADDRGADAAELGKFQQDGILEVYDISSFLDGLFHEDEDLGQRKQADEGAGDVDSVVQLINAEHEPFGSFHRVHADGGQNQAESAGHEALHHGTGGYAGDDGQAEKGEPEIFRAAEFHGQLCQKGSKEVQGNTGKQTAEEGGDARCPQGFSGFSLFGQLIPVQSGRCRSRSTRGMNENGGNGTAENSAAVNAAEHDQPCFRVHPEGEGKQKGNAHGSGKTGHASDDDADRDADDHHEQVHGLQGVAEARSHQR